MTIRCWAFQPSLRVADCNVRILPTRSCGVFLWQAGFSSINLFASNLRESNRMRHYIRARREGATYFFTVNLQQRDGNRMLVESIKELRAAFDKVRREHPFKVNAIVVLPEHLHAMWTLPVEDADFSMRWALIKAQFSRAIIAEEKVSPSRARRRERGIWQRRFYEHMIRDDLDFQAHTDYMHWNPVKHGHVERVSDWPYSSFHSHVRNGWLPVAWAGESNVGERSPMS